MNIIQKDELKQLMNNKEDFVLINVLDKGYFDMGNPHRGGGDRIRFFDLGLLRGPYALHTG